ncbi:Uncharacterised protein [Chryseobacterium nakagawai]|uniref:Lipoprotein n=1 Tax=Chryseobacterium nakagawai TaxID=1241982 RepID=A0AAD0YR08_CHRNA|nr:DUF5991 domain-containing protein [Chryseobacterium nakagawai]AZA93103.1 hypothetical protein EG343_22105 [Chryseobacterium nakagawai]VEH19746.1 Uncharacterised protein [Chryseobacterium nakagawai]
MKKILLILPVLSIISCKSLPEGSSKDSGVSLHTQWKGDYSISHDFGKLDEFAEMTLDYGLIITKDSCTFWGLGYKTFFTDVCSITGNEKQIIVKYVKQIEGDPMSNHLPTDTLAVVFRKDGKYYLQSKIVPNKQWQYDIPIRLKKKS